MPWKLVTLTQASTYTQAHWFEYKLHYEALYIAIMYNSSYASENNDLGVIQVDLVSKVLAPNSRFFPY